jgi:hypothetical protein
MAKSIRRHRKMGLARFRLLKLGDLIMPASGLAKLGTRLHAVNMGGAEYGGNNPANTAGEGRSDRTL